MNAKPVRDLAQLLAHMHAVQRPLVEQLTTEHPTARVMTVENDALKGTIDPGDRILVEPCSQFGDDGIYLFMVGNVIVLRKVHRLALRPALSVADAHGEPEIVPLDRLHDLDFVGRVVASCTVRRH